MNLSFFRHKEEPVEVRVARARDGDTRAREALLRDYTPFIMKVVSSVAGRYICQEKDDEAAIGLLAFNEAIDAYTSERAGFLAFAATVIKRRVIDHYRKENSWNRFRVEPERGGATAVLEPETRTDETDWQELLERRDEIELWKEHLERLGITLEDLIRATPKHQDSRERILEIVRVLSDHPGVLEKIREHGRFPVDEVLAVLPDDLKVSRKTLERHSTYITGALIAACGDFPFLKTYLTPGKGGKR